MVKPRIYLHFPALDPGATGKLQELQLGYCYMPRAMEQEPQQQSTAIHNESMQKNDGHVVSNVIRPLLIRNISDQELFLTCVPNLKKQCFVFAESCPALPRPSSLRDVGKGMQAVSVLASEAGSHARTQLPNSAGFATHVEELGSSGPAGATSMSQQQVEDFPLAPQSEMMLHIGLRPVLPSEAYSTG